MGILSKLFGGGTPKVQPTSLNDDNFTEEVLQHRGVVLVDVWSDNCPPCMQLEPIIMNLANEYAGRAKVAEMRAAGAPRTAGRLGVRGTPTVLYFRNGELVDRVVGFRGSLFHRQTLDHLLGEDVPA
ncbi:MAG: thioredoxin [Deltaproteobacteria bacterium]|nr:MAG: thioredoxin [Deltaproteobacteria bacterium]